MQTTPTIWFQIASIPWSIYLAIVIAWWIGLKFTKPYNIRLLAIKIAIGIGFVTAIGLMAHIAQALLIYTWLSGLIIGMGFGWIELNSKRPKLSNNKKYLLLPGSWITCIFIIFLIISRFFFYTAFIDEHQHFMLEHSGYLLFLMGAVTGFYLGRYGYYYFRIKK